MNNDPRSFGFPKQHRPGRPFVGITVMPEYLQSETVDGVLDNLVEKAGATAVATSPYLMEPASEKDGSREPFDRGKIKRGLEKACWKRPIPDARLETIIAEVENELETSFDAEVESRHVGELVMQQLRDLDQVAYVRFASVYRQFKDVQDFVNELEPMLDESRRAR